MDENDGLYTGDSIIESSANIEELILNKNNWELKSSKTTSSKDALFGLISSLIACIVEQLIFILTMDINLPRDLIKLEYRFKERESLTIKNIFGGFGLEKEMYNFKNLINKYGLIANSNTAINSLKNINTLNYYELCSIYLYQMREAFRFSNITREYNQKVNEIYYNFFLKFNSNKELTYFVEKIGKDDATYITDFLVNRSQFNKFITSRKDSFEIRYVIKVLADEGMNFAQKELNQLVKDIVKKVQKNKGAFKEYVTDILNLSAKAQKALIITSVVIEILSLIPVSSTKTYQFQIPDTHQKLEYQMTNFILSSKKFDPSEIFRVTQLKKPIKNDMYLYEGRYFPTYDNAVLQLKRNIIEDTLKTGKKIYF
ncbi:hypothetical protein [Spiroplasma endosymbiont of Atherix ibis]|uniref:hypothetical protein n=1 Tax=Spiroplasma endosymbiont of Atherix ibis TaxID=3066291 RepID=UPI0030D059FE